MRINFYTVQELMLLGHFYRQPGTMPEFRCQRENDSPICEQDVGLNTFGKLLAVGFLQAIVLRYFSIFCSPSFWAPAPKLQVVFNCKLKCLTFRSCLSSRNDFGENHVSRGWRLVWLASDPCRSRISRAICRLQKVIRKVTAGAGGNSGPYRDH